MNRIRWIAPLTILLIPAFFYPSANPDWPGFYAGARLANSQDLYSFRASNAITRKFESPNDMWAFVRPPFYASLLAPLGGFQPKTAFLIWQFVNLAALATLVMLIWPSYEGAFLAVGSAAGTSFRQGQDMPVILLLVGLTIALLWRHRFFTAGLVLALCSIKFSLFLLIPVFLLSRKMGRMTAGFLMGLVVLAGMCFAIYGRHWPQQYYDCIMMNQALLKTYSFLPFNLPLRIAVASVLVGGCAVACWKLSDIGMAFAVAVGLGLFVAPRMYSYDAAIVLPATLLIAKRQLGDETEVASLLADHLGTPARGNNLQCARPITSPRPPR